MNFSLHYHKHLSSSGKNNTYNSSKLSNFVDSKVPEGTEFDIPPVSASFIHKQLQNLKVNKATGVDDISAKYLKLSASVKSQPLATILNLSITSGIYPKRWKVGHKQLHANFCITCDYRDIWKAYKHLPDKFPRCTQTDIWTSVRLQVPSLMTDLIDQNGRQLVHSQKQ